MYSLPPSSCILKRLPPVRDARLGGHHFRHRRRLAGGAKDDPGIKAVAMSLLSDHLSHCVAQASAEGGEVAAEKVREANDAIARLVRS